MKTVNGKDVRKFVLNEMSSKRKFHHQNMVNWKVLNKYVLNEMKIHVFVVSASENLIADL